MTEARPGHESDRGGEEKSGDAVNLAENAVLFATVSLLAVSPATGAFLKLWADRAAEGGRVVGMQSRCESCGRPLASRDVVPILSWVLHGGRTRCCGETIAPGHLSAEITAISLAVWGVLSAPERLWLPTLIVAWLVQAIALLSAPDRRSACALSILLTGMGLFWAGIGLTGDFGMHLLGALIGASCAALGILDKVRGAPTIMILPAGAILGVAALPSAIFLGTALAVLHHFWCRICGRAGTPHATSVAIGLAGGIWLVWLYGPTLGL